MALPFACELDGIIELGSLYTSCIELFMVFEMACLLRLCAKDVSHALLFVDSVFASIACSIGKGFQGTIKRHGFARQAKSHGTSKAERKPGSIGQAVRSSRDCCM